VAPKAGIRLMEPIMRVEVVTPEEYMGDIIGDLNSRRGQILQESYGGKVADVAPQFAAAFASLQSNSDFVDSDRDICGVRFWFVPERHGIMYLLQRDRGNQDARKSKPCSTT